MSLEDNILDITRLILKATKLMEKGMNINDWLNSVPYDDEFSLNTLIELGDKLGFELDRE